MKKMKWMASLVVVVFISACGGGGGENPDATTNTDAKSILKDVLGKEATDPGQEKYDPGQPSDKIEPTDQVEKVDPGQVEVSQETQGTTDIKEISQDPGTDLCVEDPGSCKEFYKCLGDCPQGPIGQECQQQCQANMSPQGAQDQGALQGCLQTNGCLSKTTDEEFAQCLEDYCLDPYFKCFSGCKYKTCVEINACIAGCPQDNPQTPDVDEFGECFSNCSTDGTYEANKERQAWIDCLLKDCQVCKKSNPTEQEDVDCNICIIGVLPTKCMNQWAKCQPVGGKYKTCVEYTQCTSKCPQDNPQTPNVDEEAVCWNECESGATLQALADRYLFLSCVWKACPSCTKAKPTPQDESDCNTCAGKAMYEGECQDEFMKCQKFGTKKCGEVWGCLMQCQDDACVQGCWQEATFTASKLAQELIDCVLTVCPNGEGQCVQNALSNECKQQYEKCANDQAAQ